MDRKLNLSFALFRRNSIISAFPEFENYPKSLMPNIDEVGSLDRVAFQRNAARLMSFEEIRYVEKNYTDSEGRSLLQLVHSLKINLLIGSVFLKNNTYFCQLSEYLSRLKSHGLEQYIMSKYKSRDYEKSYERNQRHEKIKLKHLIGPLAFLISGLLFATLNFFIEILLLRIQHRYQSQLTAKISGNTDLRGIGLTL
ncbi:hypothetical protein HHI36_012596 [Cryptolaemus montrouzieri]|uniref:Uncharacterized protein n=1 Tax=Cryptolaemus montrouzieri TaxID=559131 RepID=A0ABD2NEZ8_9CUCU